MQFCRDTFMGQQREKNELKIHYHIQEWNTFTTTYDILQNHSNSPTVFLFVSSLSLVCLAGNVDSLEEEEAGSDDVSLDSKSEL